jgi:hypothetical protein
MAGFDSLPPDQKAVLGLLLKQGRSYEELATLLKLSHAAVRERALDALDALGPDVPAGLSPERQDDVCDYLLGQQGASARATTREYLENSAAGRAWARVVAAELRPLAADALPEIPAEVAEVEEAFDALQARQAARVQRERSSKLGGALLLGGLGIIVAVVLILVIGGGDDNKSKSTPAAATTPSTSSTTPKIEAQINLSPAQAGSKALGIANVISQGGQQALAVVAQALTPGKRYAVWLYNSPSKYEFLGFAPGGANKSGRLQGLAPVPNDIQSFSQIIVTHERIDRPKRPGTIVLRGSLRG